MLQLIRTLPPETLFTLCKPRDSACISLYFATEKAGRPVRQNVIRFRNLLSEAREQVSVRCPYPADQAMSLLKQVEGLARDEAFWRVQECGLGLLISRNELYAIGLPYSIEHGLYFGSAFHCSPLIPMISNPALAVLSLSQSGAQLLEQKPGEPLSASLDLTLPAGIKDILKYIETDEQLQWHGLERGGKGPSSAMFHGQGGGGADAGEHKQRIHEYCRALDDSLTPVYRRLEAQKVPLIVAAVEYVFSLFREVCRYRHLCPEPIRGNVSQSNPKDLAVKAEALLKPQENAERGLLIDRIHEAIDVDLGAKEPVLVAHAAASGYIDTALVASNRSIWAEVREDSVSPFISRDQEHGTNELLDYIVRHTIINGGLVRLCRAEELPLEADECVALFRRPVAPEFFGLQHQRQSAALELR